MESRGRFPEPADDHERSFQSPRVGRFAASDFGFRDRSPRKTALLLRQFRSRDPLQDADPQLDEEDRAGERETCWTDAGVLQQSEQGSCSEHFQLVRIAGHGLSESAVQEKTKKKGGGRRIRHR